MKNKSQSAKKKADKEIKDGDIPRTFENQNLGHNVKNEGFTGQHTKR